MADADRLEDKRGVKPPHWWGPVVAAWALVLALCHLRFRRKLWPSRAQEWKFVGGLELAVLLLGLRQAPQVLARRREAWRRERELHGPRAVCKVPSYDKPQDHPVVPWALENAIPWLCGMGYAAIHRRLAGERPSAWRLFAATLAGTCWLEEVHMGLRALLTYGVYGHTPHFGPTPAPGIADVVKGALTTNLPVMAIGSFLDTQGSLKDPARAARLRPLTLLLQLAVLRLALDAAFGLGHWALHTRPLYWIHRRHHEHHKPRLWTNYHFAALDLFVEGSFPYITAVGFLMAIRGKRGGLTPLEKGVFFGYLFSFEMESHSGKPMPTMSVFPPLSLLTRGWDDYNSWFHSKHHATLKCNYSISPVGIDTLLGTAEF